MPRRQFVHRAAGEKFKKCCMQTGTVQIRQSLMVWGGAISSTGPVSLTFVEGHIRANDYINILNEYLIPYLDNLPLNQLASSTFQQDNAPPHTARITQNFLQESAITVAEWPPFSPDLNPIENLWALLKGRIQRQHPRSMRELRDEIQSSWDAIVTPALCRKLIRSMQKRIDSVISNQGWR